MLDILVRKLRFEITQPLSSEIRQLQLIAQEGGKGENTLGESPEKSILPSPPSAPEENYRMVYQPTGKKSQHKIEIEMDEVTP